MSKHITEEQRYAISMMLQIPMSKKAIAEAIGVDKSTVYREIKRNCDARSGSYSMELAQRKADRRKQQKHRKEVLTPAMRKRIIKLLKKGFSPEQIVTAFVMFAVPSAMNVYIVTKKMGGDGELGAAIITVSMLLSAVTLPMGIWVIKTLGII